jgi:ankyrin repeat protein
MKNFTKYLLLIVALSSGFVGQGYAQKPVKKQLKALLFDAARRGDSKVTQFCLNMGANVNAQYFFGNTPLHVAVGEGNEGVVQVLLAAKADVDMHNIFGNTSLHTAATKGRAAMVAVLLAANADLDITNKVGDTAEDVARQNGHDNIVDMIKAERARRACKVVAEAWKACPPNIIKYVIAQYL